ncbi:MAG: Sec-independent protein translocase protein TatB [Steroidobacteraceae bacterium]
MFDFSFSEILIIFVLALIVLGPEKLPTVVRRVGRWIGRARAMARQLQEQLEEEIDLEGRHRSTPPPSAESAPAGTDCADLPERFEAPADESPSAARPSDAPDRVAEAAEPPESPAAVPPHEPRV